MASIEHYAGNFERKVNDFASRVDSYESDGSASESQIRGLDKELKAINEVKRDLKTEVRLLSGSAKSSWRSTISDFEDKLDNAVERFTRLKKDAERRRLLRPGGGADGEGRAQGKTNDDVLAQATDVQDKTEEAGRRALGMLNDTEKVADATDAELDRQGEQLRGIKGEVARIDGLLDASKFLVGNVARRIYTDRILLCFMMVNVVLIVAAIVYVTTSENGLTGGNDNEPQPSSSGSERL